MDQLWLIREDKDILDHIKILMMLPDIIYIIVNLRLGKFQNSARKDLEMDKETMP